MELRHIQYFVRAAELLHFTHAAESLYISQPTLSTHIQQLEDELGITLFERTGRNVHLTEAGRLYLRYAQQTLHDIDQGKEAIEDLKGLDVGEVHMGALLTFGHELLPIWVAQFHAKHPNVRMVVETGTSDYLEQAIGDRTIDLALSFVPPENPEVNWKELFREEVCLAVSETHYLAKQQTVHVSELNKLPLALVTRKWAARRIYDKFLAEHQVTPNILVEMDDLHALARVAAQGHVGLLIAKVALPPDLSGLHLLSLTGGSLFARYGAIWSGRLGPAAQAFLDHVLQKAAV